MRGKLGGLISDSESSVQRSPDKMNKESYHGQNLPVRSKGEHHEDSLSISSQLITLVRTQALMNTNISLLERERENEQRNLYIR